MQISDLKFEIRDADLCDLCGFCFAAFAFPNKIVNAKNAKAPQRTRRKKATCFTGLPLGSAVGVRGSEIPTCCKNATVPDRRANPAFSEGGLAADFFLSRASHAPIYS